MDVPAVAHQPFAGDDDVGHRAVVAAEDPGIDQRVAAAADQRRVVGVEHHEVGAAADRDRADLLARGLGAADFARVARKLA